jgi:hypothetical protein
MALVGNSCSGCLTGVCAQVQVHAHTTVGGRYKPGSCHAHKAEEVHERPPCIPVPTVTWQHMRRLCCVASCQGACSPHAQVIGRD